MQTRLYSETLQLEQLSEELAKWTSIPIPAAWAEEELQQTCPQLAELNQHLYRCVLEKLLLPPPPHPLDPSSYGGERLRDLLAPVWSPVDTLFVSRQQLEVVGVTRRTVSNTREAVDQVSTIGSRVKCIAAFSKLGPFLGQHFY